MAHLKIWKDGRLIKEKQIDDTRAQQGYEINLGSGKSIVLKTGQTKTIGSYKLEVVGKNYEPVEYSQTDAFLETSEDQLDYEGYQASIFNKQNCVVFSFFTLALILLVGIAIFFYLKMNQSKVKLKDVHKQLEVQKKQLTEKYLAAEEKANKNLVSIQTRGIKKFTLTGDKLFAPGSVKIKPAAIKEIKTIAKQTKENFANCEVLVIGYTDAKPLLNPKTKKRFHDNWNLGAQRALAVMRILMQHDIPGDKLSAVTRGPFHLKKTEKQSRRVEILLCPSEGKNIYEKSNDKLVSTK